MDSLKPCPFCGTDHPPVFIPRFCKFTCVLCLAETRSIYGKFADWNTRPIEDALRAELASAKEVGQRLADAYDVLEAKALGLEAELLKLRPAPPTCGRCGTVLVVSLNGHDMECPSCHPCPYRGRC